MKTHFVPKSQSCSDWVNSISCFRINLVSTLCELPSTQLLCSPFCLHFDPITQTTPLSFSVLLFVCILIPLHRPLHSASLFSFLSAFRSLCPAAEMFKNRLREYAQKNSLPLPVYTTVNEGQDHLPEFKCSVTVNGARYDSPSAFKYKKEAENAAAQVAVEDFHIQFKETKLLKNVLNEFAVKKNIPLPVYQFTKEGIPHSPTFTATVEINGESYTGAPSNNTKEAARNAAYEAIRSICTQYCNSFPQIELHDETKQKDVPTVPKKINVENPCEVGGASEV